MKWLTVGLPLLLRFVLEVVKSGLATAWLVVRPGRRPVPGLIRMRYSGLDESGVVVLGCMITLTPGTTTIDIDAERGELLLHLLDTSDAAGAVSGIRTAFERPLQRLFPARRSA